MSARDAAGEYERLWAEQIGPCEKCKHDRRIDPTVRAHWQAVETPFLPYPGVGPEPSDLPVRYLLVGMEPSLKPRKKKTRQFMLREIAEGSRNFKRDAHIRWAAHHWLVKKGEAFVMTDMAKCMLPTKAAVKTAPRRYANCLPWLEREIALFPRLRAIIPLGKEPHRWLLAFAQESWPTVTRPIVHPGHRFTKGWKRGEADYNRLPSGDEFAEFAKSCDPRAKPHHLRLDTRRRGLLARWQVQFAEIRAELDRLGHEAS